MLPDIDSTFFHVLCGNLIVSKGSLYVYIFELNLRNLLYVILSYIVSNLNEKTPEAFCKKYDESYSDDFSSDAANIFECLFCYRFGYPFGYFKGISDYDGTIMFFCNAQYSPKTYNKKFGELTEAIFIKELREFFYELFKDDYYKTVELELCEEYLKE